MQRFASQRAAVTRRPLGTKLHARKHAHRQGADKKYRSVGKTCARVWLLARALVELKDVEYARRSPCACYWLDLRDCVCYSDIEQNGCS